MSPFSKLPWQIPAAVALGLVLVTSSALLVKELGGGRGKVSTPPTVTPRSAATVRPDPPRSAGDEPGEVDLPGVSANVDPPEPKSMPRKADALRAIPTRPRSDADPDRTPPRAISKTPPEYPADAARAGIQGLVVVQAWVDRDGIVRKTQIVKSIPALDHAAEACAREWVFIPAHVKGRPVAAWVAIPVRFTLH